MNDADDAYDNSAINRKKRLTFDHPVISCQPREWRTSKMVFCSEHLNRITRSLANTSNNIPIITIHNYYSCIHSIMIIVNYNNTDTRVSTPFNNPLPFSLPYPLLCLFLSSPFTFVPCGQGSLDTS